MTATRLAELDLPESNAMRAPGEATGMMALEIAMDEMAEKLGIDPVEFRIRNDTQVVPDDPGKPRTDPQARGSKPAKRTVLPAQARGMPAAGRRAVRLGQAQCRPGQPARRTAG